MSDTFNDYDRMRGDFNLARMFGRLDRLHTGL
jgi:hypothetical protein